MKKMTLLFVGLILSVCAFAFDEQGVIYVKATAMGDGSGSSWVNACTDIQKALDKAKEANITDVKKRPNLHLSGSFTLTTWIIFWAKTATDLPFSGYDGVNIYGGFQGVSESETLQGRPMKAGGKSWEFQYPTVITQTGNSNIVNCGGYGFTTGSGKYNGITFTGGKGGASGEQWQSSGGAIYIRPNQEVKQCIFKNNIASTRGGAIYSYGLSNIVIEDCYFLNNSATGNGGAISLDVNSASSNVVIRNCVFNGNRGVDGAAIEVANNGTTGTPKLSLFTNLVMINNTASTGSIVTLTSTESSPMYTLVNSLIAFNEGAYGVLVKGGNVVNNTIVNNSLTSSGAGFPTLSPDPIRTFENNVIWNNKDVSTGRVIWIQSNLPSGAKLTVNNNAAKFDFSSFPMPTKADNLEIWSNFSNGNQEEGVGIGVGPNFVNPRTSVGKLEMEESWEDFDYSIKAISALCGIGRVAAVPAGVTKDLKGNPRLSTDNKVSIGAYECDASSSISGASIQGQIPYYIESGSLFLNVEQAEITISDMGGTCLKKINAVGPVSISLPKGAYIVTVKSSDKTLSNVVAI